MAYGLTSAQWRMLLRVCKMPGGAAQSHFAGLQEIEPISVSRLLDRMEAMGWVTRAPDPRDRRVRRVFLTPKALEAFANFKPVADAVYAEALVGITPDQHRQLLDALGCIVSNLARPRNSARKTAIGRADLTSKGGPTPESRRTP